MAGPSDPIDLPCEAPPYTVVRACEQLGFRTPLDVRWSRVDRRPHVHHGGRPWDTFWRRPWELLWGQSPAAEFEPSAPSCDCGQPLPPLEKYCFTFITGRQADYLMCQCRRCRAIFWQEV
jgi:hypothetical protein